MSAIFPRRAAEACRYRSGLAIVLLLIAACACLSAQQTPGSTFQPPRTSHAPTPVSNLSDFDAVPETDYTFVEGDEIQLDVWGRTELSAKHVVGPDGKITLPYVGQLLVRGLTRAELEQSALTRWQDYYENLQVTANVLHYKGTRIYILGRVLQGGVAIFDKQPTLLEALARAGVIGSNGTGGDKPGMTRCVVFRGKDRVAWVDLRGLLREGNLAYNIRLQREDTLYLPDGDDELVYIMGEVLRPGAVRLTPGMSFMDALAQAGGPNKDASSTLHLVRHSAGIEREIKMNEITHKGKDPNVALESGDVIYVGRSGLAKLGYLLQQLSPAISYMTFASGVKNF